MHFYCKEKLYSIFLILCTRQSHNEKGAFMSNESDSADCKHSSVRYFCFRICKKIELQHCNLCVPLEIRKIIEGKEHLLCQKTRPNYAITILHHQKNEIMILCNFEQSFQKLSVQIFMFHIAASNHSNKKQVHSFVRK